MACRLLAAALLLLLVTAPGQAEEKLRVGKAILNSFTFALLDVGIENGLYRDNALEIAPVTFAGALKLQQALVSEDIDIGLSTGPDIGYIAKGEPVMAVAAIAGAPSDSVLLTRADDRIGSIADLKGKTVAVSNARSYPAWLVMQLSRHEGWGRDGMTILATGSQMTSLALLKTGQVNAWVADIGTALQAQARREGRIVVNFAGVVPDFLNTAIYASDKLIKTRPEALRRFLKAWFKTIAFADTHKEATVGAIAPVLDLDRQVVDRVYDLLMPIYERDGRFHAKALETMRRAVVDLGIVDAAPDMSKLYTEEFLPKM